MGQQRKQARKIAPHSSRRLCLEHDSVEAKHCHFCPFHRSNLAEVVAKKGASKRPLLCRPMRLEINGPRN